MKKIVLITGANRGLGLETARQMGLLGYSVVVAARDEKKADVAAHYLTAQGIEAHPIKLDITNESDHEQVSQFLDRRFGRLDVLINNAGVQLDFPSFIPGNNSKVVSGEVLRSTFETNYFGPVLLTSKLLPLLEKSEAGRIVNVSSIMGSMALHSDVDSPIHGIKLLAYNSSKTALNQFTIHLAAALQGTNIKVNSAHPGWVKTNLGGDYAPMETPEGAKTIVDLSLIDEQGPEGAFIHLGEVIPW
jgi:NAD(P)-dependent dehydrogenase (short-subunit alcohol dehydrogenase family)